MGQHVCALCHKMHAAEHNVLSIGARCLLRQFVRVAAKIGKADDLIALVMVAQDDRARAQDISGLSDAAVHAVIGKDEIIVEGAAFRPLDCWSNSN